MAQHQHGGNSSSQLTGDAQNINFGTNADGRSQLGHLWYQQELFDDQLRLKVGKWMATATSTCSTRARSFSTAPSRPRRRSF